MVREFVDLFPTDLPGLPRDRDIDFGIDVGPGTLLVFIQPFQMAPTELNELKEHFHDLLGKWFIRSSVSP